MAGVELLVQDEPRVEVRVLQGPAGLLDQLDHLQISAALQAHHRVARQVREVVLVVGEDLGRERGSSDVQQILAKRLLVRGVVLGGALERLLGDGARLAEALDDGHGVDLLVDEVLSLAQEFAREDHDGGCAVAHLVVLRLGDVDEDPGGGVVDVDGLEDGGAVVGDGHLVALGDGHEDLVHALGTEGALDEIGDRHGADEGREARVLALLLGGALLEHGWPGVTHHRHLDTGCLSSPA